MLVKAMRPNVHYWQSCTVLAAGGALAVWAWWRCKSNDDIVRGGKGMMDRLAVAHLAERRCYCCDYETLRTLLTPREGVSYMTARLALSCICPHCASVPKRAMDYVLGTFGGMYKEVNIYIPQVLHARFLDGSWLKDSRDKYAVIATMSQTLRDIYDIEEETGVYGSELRYLITSLHTWVPTLYKAEATPVYSCFEFACSKTTRWRPYRKDSPLMLAIEHEERQYDQKRLEAELNKYSKRKDNANGDGESDGSIEDTDFGSDSGLVKDEPEDAAKTPRQIKREQVRERKTKRMEEKFEKLNRSAEPTRDKKKAEDAIKHLEMQIKLEQTKREQAQKQIDAIVRETEAKMKAMEQKEATRVANHEATEIYNEAMSSNDPVPCLKGQTVPLEPVNHKDVKVNEHRPGDDKRTLEKWHDVYAESPERAAALISTITHKVTFFEENPANAYEAIRKRMLKQGARDFKASKSICKRLKNTTQAYINTFLKPEKVRKAFLDMGGIGACKPNAWSEERWWAALLKLIEGEVPRGFKLTIKPEAGTPGKAPRPISNEGDLWQALNSVVFKVIEMLDSVQLTFHNIKHKDLAERHASLKTVGELVTGIICEGDGSAWDACCGPEIQKYIEQPVFSHVADIVYEMILEFSPGARKAAHHRRTAKKMSYELYTKTSMDKATLRQRIGIGLSFVMRSSGDSGTSYLNRLVNMIGWVVGIAAEPEKLVSKMGQAAPYYKCLFEKDETGKPLIKRVGCFFEGDDSLLFLSARIKSFQDQIESYWKSIGFNMKLKFIEDSTNADPAEFCGYHYWIDNGKLTGACMPDGRRSLRNCQITVSKEALKSPQARDSIAAGSAIGRQCQHSHGFAPLSDVYEAKSEAYGGWDAACGASLTTREEKELSYKITGKYEEGVALTPDVLTEAYLAQRNYYAKPEAMIPLAKASLQMTSQQLSLLAGAGPLIHSDHPDAAAAFCQA